MLDLNPQTIATLRKQSPEQSPEKLRIEVLGFGDPAIDPESVISRTVFSDIFNKKQATFRVLSLFIAALQKKNIKPNDFEDFIDYQRDKRALPDKASFYAALEHTRFLSHAPNSHQDGVDIDIKWWNQRSRFFDVPKPDFYPEGVLCFHGTSVNNLSVKPFALVAQRVSPFLFTVTGFHPRKVFAYQASFTKLFTVEDTGQEILTGSWIGMDHTCHSATYRCFISKDPIELSSIEAALATHKIANHDGKESKVISITWDEAPIKDELLAVLDYEPGAKLRVDDAHAPGANSEAKGVSADTARLTS